MKTSPFTFKRYLIAVAWISTITFGLASLHVLRTGESLWLAAIFTPCVGFALPIPVWFVGEIVWRGSRSCRTRYISTSRIKMNFTVGITLAMLSCCIPNVGEHDEPLRDIARVISFVITLYATGQLIGIRTMKRTEPRSSPYSKS